MDTLDGRYSRMSGKGTPFGAFLDSTLDRLEEGIVLTAVGAYFAAQRQRGGGRGDGRGGAGIADGVLHPRPRRGARRRVQGGPGHPPGARGDPVGGPGIRKGRVGSAISSRWRPPFTCSQRSRCSPCCSGSSTSASSSPRAAGSVKRVGRSTRGCWAPHASEGVPRHDERMGGDPAPRGVRTSPQ